MLQVKIIHSKTIQQITVASVAQGQDAISHAMVLDTYNRNQDLLIFKNTYDDPSNGQPKRFTIERTHTNAPKKLFFVNIEIRDMDNLPSQKQRETDKEAEIEKKRQPFKKN